MSFFKELTEVGKVVAYYKMVTIITILTCIIGITIMGIYVTNKLEEVKTSGVIISPIGEVYAARQASSSAIRVVEAKAHVGLFINLFFEINKHTYKDKIAKSYSLGNTSIFELHKKLIEDKWFEQIESYNVYQTINIIEITCTKEQPFTVVATFHVNIDSELGQKKYLAVVSCTVQDKGSDRTDANPHAMSIERLNFNGFEEILK